LPAALAVNLISRSSPCRKAGAAAVLVALLAIILARTYSPGLLASICAGEPHFLETLSNLFQVEIEGAELLQLAILEMLRDFRVALKLFDKISVIAPSMFDFPCLHRVALDQFIGLFASQPLFDQGQQDGLRIPHPERELEVASHVLGINDESFDQ